MHLFTFEPGDGYSYKVIFGRMPGRGLIPFYTVFGLAQGATDPGVWYAFDTDQVSEEIFTQHLFAHIATSDEYCALAWCLWQELTGQTTDMAGGWPWLGWRPDWRRQLPVMTMG